MKSTPRPQSNRYRWMLLSALAAILVIAGVAYFTGMTDDAADAPVVTVVAAVDADHTGPPERDGEEEGPERITLEEYARRAAAGRDQAPVGKVFVRPGVQKASAAAAGLDWQPIGPRPFTNEYWSGNADAGGRVCAIIVDPNDPDIAYLGGAQGGVWKTVDGGVNWTPLTDHLSSLASGALAFDPTDSDIVWYGTGEQHFSGDSFYGDGLFRTTDAGVTWTKIAARAVVGSYISRVVVAPDNNQIMYLGSDLGFLRSTDGGTTWTATQTSSYCTDILVDPTQPGTVFAAVWATGILKSTDYGATWTQLTNGLPSGNYRRINFASAPSNPQVMYAAYVAADYTLFGMYKTTDGGLSWTELAATPDYLRGQGFYDSCIIVDPDNPDICYAGGTFPYGGEGNYGLIRTADGGFSWNDINIGIDGSQPHPDHHIFAWGSDGRLWLGNDGGVWHTSNGGQTWTNCNATLALAQFYTNTVHPTNPARILGGTQDNGTAQYYGADAWPQVIGGDGGPTAYEWNDPGIYYTTYVYLDPLYKWQNGSYVGTVTGPWTSENRSWCNGPLVVDPNQPSTLLVGGQSVYRTTNGGASWSTLSGDLAGGAHLRALAVAEGFPNTIYSGSSNGLVYVTTDGANWTLRSTGLPANPIPDIFIDPADWQTAYICADRSTSSRVYKTVDAGASWSSITGDLPAGVRAMSMAVDFRVDPARLYVGTDYGVYASYDEGTSWQKAEDNLPSLAIYDLTVDEFNSLLVAATHGRGSWRAALDITAPAVAVTAPTNGDALVVEGDYDITWTATDAVGVETVTIELSRDGGATYPETLAAGVANTGTWTWMVSGPDAPNCRVRVTAEDGSHNVGTALSDGTFSIILASPVGDGLPQATALRGAAPNPFNPSTTISFDLGRRAHARLQIFTVDGRLVATLVDETLAAGPHRAVWNGTDAAGQHVASGQYLFTLSTEDGYRETGKVLMVK